MKGCSSSSSHDGLTSGLCCSHLSMKSWHSELRWVGISGRMHSVVNCTMYWKIFLIDLPQGFPAIAISMTVQPKDQTSALKQYPCCIMTSGAIHGIVPLIALSCSLSVISELMTQAQPKSDNLILPCASKSTFADFRS